jgi:RNase adaptor protein for sRNA GlmZ degradation
MSDRLYTDPETHVEHTRLANPPLPLIKVVGVSGSGKSTLVRGLREAGYDARPVSQEHSHIADLWQQFDPPRILLYLEADLACQQHRRPDVAWTAEHLQEERIRLAHAFEHADLALNTARLDAPTLLKIVQAFLAARQVRRHNQPLPPLPATGSSRVATI